MQPSEEAKFAIIPGIEIQETDFNVKKEYSNAFWKTDLEKLVREQGIDLLILSGYAAEHCVLFTYNGAAERVIKAVLLQNGILSSHQDVITAAQGPESGFVSCDSGFGGVLVFNNKNLKHCSALEVFLFFRKL